MTGAGGTCSVGFTELTLIRASLCLHAVERAPSTRIALPIRALASVASVKRAHDPAGVFEQLAKEEEHAARRARRTDCSDPLLCHLALSPLSSECTKNPFRE